MTADATPSLGIDAMWYAYSDRQTVGPFPTTAEAWSYVEALLRAGYLADWWKVGRDFATAQDAFGGAA